MTESDKARLYADLIKHPGWKLLEDEIGALVKRTTDAVMNDLEGAKIQEKAIVAGMNLTISLPTDTIAQLNKQVEKEEAQSS